MSCITYLNNDPFGLGKYISGTTCNGTTNSYILQLGDSVCMEAEQPLVVCDGISISGSCDSPAVTPTPTTTTTPTPTPTCGGYAITAFTSSGSTDTNLCCNPQPVGTLYSPQPFFTDGQQFYRDACLTQYIDWMDDANVMYLSTGGTQLYFYGFATSGLGLYGLTCDSIVCPSPTPTTTTTPTQTNTPTPSATSGGATPTPTRTPTPTPSPQIYTHGTVRATCSDFCNTNYNIDVLTNATANYTSLTIGDTIFGQGGVAGFVAYSNISTDTTTGPFRIAEINTSGVILGIYVCVAGVCDPL